MVVYLYGPSWFHGIDTTFEIVSIVVSFLIFYFSYKTYKLTSQKKYLIFSISFLLIAISFFFKIISNMIIYSKELQSNMIGMFTLYFYTINRYEWFNFLSIFLYRFLMLIAFMIILLLCIKIKDKKLIAILIYFIIISTLFSSSSYFIFNLTLAIVLGFISYFYYHNYLNRKSKNSMIVAFSFIFIFISQLFFMFLIFSKGIYVLGEILQLFGYLLLLYTYICIIRK